MLKTKLKKSKTELLNEFYSKDYYLSYSGLNKLLYSPSLFYNHYILQQREETVESYLIQGKLIHCLLLDDGSFNDQFLLMPNSIPTANTKAIIDKVFNLYSKDEEDKEFLEDYSSEILELLVESNLHQRLADDKNGGKTGDEKRLEKIITQESRSYFEFLKIRNDKVVVDEANLAEAREAVEVLKSNSEVSDLLGLLTHDLDPVEIHNEIALQVQLGDYPFGLKGILDNVKINFDEKVVYINDLKKTSKSISDFEETIDYYNYWAQAAIYVRLAHSYFSSCNEEGWKVVFNFVVVDKYLQTYVFEVSEGTMKLWQTKLDLQLDIVKWHYENKKFNLPYHLAVRKYVL